jgi:hypothetical protein
MTAESLVFRLSWSGELRSFDPSAAPHFDDPLSLVVTAVAVTLWRRCRKNLPRPINVSAAVAVAVSRVGDSRQHFYEIERRHQGEQS